MERGNRKQTPVNILIIDGSVAFTGAFKCALNEAELLRQQHESVFVLPAQTTLLPILKEKGFTTYTLPVHELARTPKALLVYPFFLLKNLIALRRIVRKENIDVVQVNDFYNLLGAGLKLFGFKGKLITYVRFLPSVIPAPLRKLWTSISQKYSNAVVAVSDAVWKQLPASKNTIRIYDPVFLTETLPSEPLDRPEITFLFMGNFTRGKGQEHAINALAKAYKANPDLRLKFVGGDMGLEKNKAFKEELIQLANEHHLNDMVSFHSFIPDVEREIKHADVILNLSEGESFSLTCLEGSFYSRPVIATRCGGPEEIVEDGVTGILVDKADTDAICAAMLLLAGNKALRMEYGNNGSKYVRQKFSTDKFVAQFNTLLQDA